MQAQKRQPTNPQVIASIKAGVTLATIWHTDTPDDVVSWLKKYHNQFHTGAGYSFIECMEDFTIWLCCVVQCKRAENIRTRISTFFVLSLHLVQDIPKWDAQWAAYKLMEGITSRGGRLEASYESLYWGFLQPLVAGKIKSFDAYQAGKSTINAWKRLGHTAVLLETAAADVDFTHPMLSIEGTFRSLHALQLQLANCSDSISAANLLVIQVECFKLLDWASRVTRLFCQLFRCWCSSARAMVF